MMVLPNPDPYPAVRVDIPCEAADNCQHRRTDDIADLGGAWACIILHINTFCMWCFYCSELKAYHIRKVVTFIHPLGEMRKPGQGPGFIASNGDSFHPIDGFRFNRTRKDKPVPMWNHNQIHEKESSHWNP